MGIHIPYLLQSVFQKKEKSEEQRSLRAGFHNRFLHCGGEPYPAV